MATVTTFAIFQQLLKKAVDGDSSLNTATQAAMKSRIDDLARHKPVSLDYSNVDSAFGDATVSLATRSIEVATGSSGNSRIEWNLMRFDVPVTIDGGITATGFLPGNVGASANPAVDSADLTMQYRLSSSEQWKAFDRNTILEGVTQVQFAADIADQTVDSALPALHLLAKQE